MTYYVSRNYGEENLRIISEKNKSDFFQPIQSCVQSRMTEQQLSELKEEVSNYKGIALMPLDLQNRMLYHYLNDFEYDYEFSGYPNIIVSKWRIESAKNSDLKNNDKKKYRSQVLQLTREITAAKLLSDMGFIVVLLPENEIAAVFSGSQADSCVNGAWIEFKSSFGKSGFASGLKTALIKADVVIYEAGDEIDDRTIYKELNDRLSRIGDDVDKLVLITRSGRFYCSVKKKGNQKIPLAGVNLQSEAYSYIKDSINELIVNKNPLNETFRNSNAILQGGQKHK